MSEKTKEPTFPKRMVSLNVAIALGIICIVLVALIAYFSIIGIQAQNSYSNLQSQNRQLQANNTNLQSQVSNLTDFENIAYLDKDTVWVNSQTMSQPASSYTNYTFSASWAGYVEVWIQSSSVAGTHVKVIYNAYGVNFNQEIVVVPGASAEFPILPSSSIQVEIGNSNIINGATETVMITYYY
jgi:cell division protein FtsB